MSPYNWRKNVAKLSLKEVADLIGFSPSYLSEVENGQRDGSIRLFKELHQVSNRQICIEGFLKGKKYEEELKKQQEATQCASA